MPSSFLAATLALIAAANAFHPNFSQISKVAQNGAGITNQIVARDVVFGSRLALAIDTTGSMGGYVGAMRPNIKKLIQDRQATPNQPSLLVLSPFNDPGTGPLTATSDPMDFAAALDTLSFGGGGDCPEVALAGVGLALESLPAGGTLFVVTDASAKDASLARNIIASAVAKRVKIFFFLFDNICGTGEPAFTEIATGTGGQILTGLKLEDASRITALVDGSLKANHEDFALILPDPTAATINLTAAPTPSPRQPAVLLMKRDPFAATTSFAVDSSVSSLVLSVDGARAVTVTRPGGTVVGAADPGTQIVTLTRGVIMLITGPAAGSWTVSIGDCNACSISIFGEASTHFTSFEFLQPRPGGQPGLVPVGRSPIIGCTYRAGVTVDGAVSDVVLELRRVTGELVQAVSLAPVIGVPGAPPGAFSGEVPIANLPFQVYLRARDASGNVVLRTYPGLVSGVAGSGSCPFGGTSSSSSSSSSSSATPGSTSSTSSSTTASSSVTSSGVTGSATANATVTSASVTGSSVTSSGSGSAGAVTSTTATPIPSVTSSGASGNATFGGTRTTTTPVSSAAGSGINGSVRSTSTIVETRVILAPCPNKAACSKTPCARPGCIADPAVHAIPPCSAPGCVGPPPSLDTVTTV